MRIGISMSSVYPVKDVRDGARRMIERAKAAADAKLDSLFVGDHHITPNPYYQNTPILGRMLAEWYDAPAGALYLLPLRHPVLLAEEIATLASITPNRFIMQCGIGYGEKEFAAFDVNIKHRPSRFEESLEIMQRLWAGETISHQGRWSIPEAHISPIPPEKIEVWIGAKAAPAIERAARLGDGWIAAPNLTLEETKQSLDLYINACAKHHRKPGVKSIRRDIYIGETQAEAQATTEKVIAAGYRGFSPESLVIGDVEEVADTFQKLEQIGYDEVLIRNLVPDQNKALACITRLAKVKELE